MALAALIAFGLIGVLLAEVGARLAGVISFPLFEANNHIGYIPAPSQSGAFLRKNDWVFNERSMGVAAPFAPSADKLDILLVGDSIVFGGNSYRQADRLGPQLARETGAQVWPISASSWALQNELAWLSDNEDVVRGVDAIVFVLNTGDFGGPSSWSSEDTHPRSRPTSALWYAISKYLLRTSPAPTPNDLLVEPRNWRGDFAAFAAATNVPITVVLYPGKNRDGDRSLPMGYELGDLGAEKIITVSEDPSWNDDLYLDVIHPTPEGNGVLAKIIAKSL